MDFPQDHHLYDSFKFSDFTFQRGGVFQHPSVHLHVCKWTTVWPNQDIKVYFAYGVDGMGWKVEGPGASYYAPRVQFADTNGDPNDGESFYAADGINQLRDQK